MKIWTPQDGVVILSNDFPTEPQQRVRCPRQKFPWLLRIICCVFLTSQLPLPNCCGENSRAKTDSPPNIIIIFTDDQGYADVGVFGAKGFKTPNLDRLASQGCIFRNFHVAQPVCSASRAALLTGCYPNRIGILGALGPTSKDGISDQEKTIAEVLKPRDYATAIYGKWHLGHLDKFLPTRHGFDDYFGLPYSNDMWPKHPTAKFPDLPLIEGEKTVETNPDQSKLTARYTERGV